MERKMVRLVLVESIALVIITLATVGVTACDNSAKCPQHDIDSKATGKQKYTDGGQKHWAEYKCPGFQNDPEHTFWVQCD
jgi:hypothetical protein